MLAIQECQLSIFGSFSFPSTAENVAGLMNVLSDASSVSLLPNIISVPKIDLLTNQAAVTPNLGFVSEDMRLRIALLDDRVDVAVSKANSDDLELDETLQKCVALLVPLMASRSLLSNRLAVNLQYVDASLSKEKIAAFRKKAVSTFGYYREKDPIEWSMRVNSRIPINIASSVEETNNITQLFADQPETNTDPILIAHLDLNTLPENKVLRFDHDALVPFVKAIAPIARNISASVEEMVCDA